MKFNRKLPKHYKLLLIAIGLSFHIVFSQTLPVNEFHVFPSELDVWGFSPEHVAVGVNHHLYFLDSINKLAVSITPDNNTHIVELSQDGLFDPVDIAQYGLSVWILDRMDNKIVEYDLKLNNIRTHILHVSYPEKMTVDLNGNIFVFSNQMSEVWKNPWENENTFSFIDLELYPDNIYLFVDINVNTLHDIALLDDGGRTHVFNRVGRYIASNQHNISEPKFVYYKNNGWELITSSGDLQTSIGTIMKLNLNQENISDISIMNNKLLILTKTGWWVVDYELSITN